MASDDHKSDFARIASRETNAQKGTMATPARRLEGTKAPGASNPMKNGGISRAKSKSSLQ